jgi:hypothetical protein
MYQLLKATEEKDGSGSWAMSYFLPGIYYK